MHEPWFNEMLCGWIPGTVLGILGGLEGALAGTLAPQGKCKRLVLGFHFSVMGACLVLLVLGIVAFAIEQPHGVWYGLGLPGLLGLALFGWMTPLLFRRYREAALRKSGVKDL
jgi:uncharacterized membrane protein YeaQ/YmgE (transglycosylase-associated protein family)